MFDLTVQPTAGVGGLEPDDLYAFFQPKPFYDAKAEHSCLINSVTNTGCSIQHGLCVTEKPKE